MSDFNATADSDDAFTADEQAAFDAYAAGELSGEPASTVEAPAGGEPAPAPVAPAAAPAGEPAAPGDVVDPDLEADDANENSGKFVRHGAFHQARQRYKAEKAARVALEAQVADLREQFARADERLRVVAQPAAAQAPAEPETPPDPNEDIFGYAKYLEKQIQDIRVGQTQLTEAQKAEREVQARHVQRGETMNAYRGDIQRVMAAAPEFSEAYEHLFQGRVTELKYLGVSEADALKAVRDEEMEMAQAAIAAGQSPGERILQLARIRGFAPKAAAPVATAAPAETAAEKAARISKGQAGSLSLSSAGGAPAGELTLEMLASMSEAEFAKMEKANPGRVRALMGGE